MRLTKLHIARLRFRDLQCGHQMFRLHHLRRIVFDG